MYFPGNGGIGVSENLGFMSKIGMERGILKVSQTMRNKKIFL